MSCSTIFGILTIIDLIDTTPGCLKTRKVFIFQRCGFYNQLKFHNLGPGD